MTVKSKVSTLTRFMLAVSFLCGFAVQSNAQSIQGDILDVLKVENERNRFSTTVRYSDLLEETYNTILSTIDRWAYTSSPANAATNAGFLEEMAEGEGEIDTDVFQLLNGTVLDDWGIRARLCDDTLLVYYQNNNFKSGITALSILIAQQERLRRSGALVSATSDTGLALINVGAPPTTLTMTNGSIAQIPDCMQPSISINSSFNTDLPAETVAYMGAVDESSVVGKPQIIVESNYNDCIGPPIHPPAVQALGTNFVGPGQTWERTVTVFKNLAGTDVSDNRASVDWEIVHDGCRPPETRTVANGGNPCSHDVFTNTAIVDDQDSYTITEARDLNDPTKIIWIRSNDSNLDSLCTTQVVTSTSQNITTTPCELVFTPTWDIDGLPPYDPYDQGTYAINDTLFGDTLVSYDAAIPDIPLNVSVANTSIIEDCHRDLIETRDLGPTMGPCPGNSVNFDPGNPNPHPLRSVQFIYYTDYASQGHLSTSTIAAADINLGPVVMIADKTRPSPCHTLVPVPIRDDIFGPADPTAPSSVGCFLPSSPNRQFTVFRRYRTEYRYQPINVIAPWTNSTIIYQPGLPDPNWRQDTNGYTVAQLRALSEPANNLTFGPFDFRDQITMAVIDNDCGCTAMKDPLLRPPTCWQ